ncbi:uncharacterized protein LOC143034881 [Oratosquilla oratoria]|uniref:uncharacterized protein LOC143034881 n=1 Tax=Oratosquilla oratoria TaxID=337810 RepID=UPI003F760D57
MEGAWTRLTTAAAAAAAAAATAASAPLPQPQLPYSSLFLDQASLAQQLTPLSQPLSSSSSSTAYCSRPPHVVTPDFYRGLGVMGALVGYPQQVLPGYLGFNSPIPPGFVGLSELDRVHQQIPPGLLTPSSSSSLFPSSSSSSLFPSSSSSTNCSISYLPTLTRMSPSITSSSSPPPPPPSTHPPPPPPLQCFSSMSNPSTLTKSAATPNPSADSSAATPDAPSEGELQGRVLGFHSHKSGLAEEVAAEDHVDVGGTPPAGDEETGHGGARGESGESERARVVQVDTSSLQASAPSRTPQPSPSPPLPRPLLSSSKPSPLSNHNPKPPSPQVTPHLSPLPSSHEPTPSQPHPTPTPPPTTPTTVTEATTTTITRHRSVPSTDPLQDNNPSSHRGKGRLLREPPQPMRPLKCINCNFATYEDRETLLDQRRLSLPSPDIPLRPLLLLSRTYTVPAPQYLRTMLLHGLTTVGLDPVDQSFSEAGR